MNKVLLYIGMFVQDVGIAIIAISASISSPVLSAVGALLFVAGSAAIFEALLRMEDGGEA